MPLATNTDYGNSLFNVHMLKKKNQVCKVKIINIKIISIIAAVKLHRGIMTCYQIVMELVDCYSKRAALVSSRRATELIEIWRVITNKKGINLI